MRYLVIMWTGAAVYFIAGIHIMKSRKPARLSIFTEIPSDRVTDLAAYNREVGKMWRVLSAVFFAGGIAEGFKPAFSLLIFALFCTLGVGVSAWRQSKIEEKYLVR